MSGALNSGASLISPLLTPAAPGRWATLPLAWRLAHSRKTSCTIRVELDERGERGVVELADELFGRGRDDRLGQAPLLVEQIGDALLEGARAHEGVDDDTPALTDAPHAVGGLVLDRGVPPPVEVDDVVGPHEVETRTAGLERHAQHRRAVLG